MTQERTRTAKILSRKIPKKEDGTAVKIGVGVTVHNRFDVTDESLSHWRSMLPKDSVMVVVDDASDVPYSGADFRFDSNVGIPRAKNKCFELLEQLGVDQFFLADSDCYPKRRDWWEPYVNSPEPHLSYQFLELVGPVKLHDMKELYRDSHHAAYTGQRGCLLYYEKSCLAAVGGFDTVFGRGFYEHVDLASRIHESGLTSWRFADVVNSHKYWHSMDEYVQVNRTIPKTERSDLVAYNAKLYRQRLKDHYRAYVPYKEATIGDKDILITTFLTANIDPQRGKKWSSDSSLLSPWLETMERGEWEGIILADELKTLPPGYLASRVINVEASSMNVYYQRWLHIYQYLRENEDIRWVWCTDGTDVEILRDPFKSMLVGRLYVGVEPTIISNPWLSDNHPSELFQTFIKRFSKSPLLNAGVVGGDRETVKELARKIVSLYNDLEAERFFKQDLSAREIGDMAAFNKVVYEDFGSRMYHGPDITTEFKGYKDNGTAKFKHK